MFIVVLNGISVTIRPRIVLDASAFGLDDQNPRRFVLLRRGRPRAGMRLSTRYSIFIFAQYARLSPFSPSSLTA